eukprot:5906792-Pleurochrysis_carterae.AAC.2
MPHYPDTTCKLKRSMAHVAAAASQPRSLPPTLYSLALLHTRAPASERVRVRAHEREGATWKSAE